MSNIQTSNLSAAKCLVYDGADAEDFTNSDAARNFLDEGGILINNPYLSAETALAKFNETAKLREEIEKSSLSEVTALTELVKRFSGLTVFKSCPG